MQTKSAKQYLKGRARFFISCKKSFIFSARLEDFVQDLASLARKRLARFAYFLQDGFYWVVRDPEFIKGRAILRVTGTNKIRR